MKCTPARSDIADKKIRRGTCARSKWRRRVRARNAWLRLVMSEENHENALGQSGRGGYAANIGCNPVQRVGGMLP